VCLGGGGGDNNVMGKCEAACLGWALFIIRMCRSFK